MPTKKVFYDGKRATIHSVAGEIRPGENVFDEGIAYKLIQDGIVQEITDEEESYVITPEDYDNIETTYPEETTNQKVQKTKKRNKHNVKD